MRKYTNLPIKQLVSDVAVDPVHVRELADSIKISGPISPVLVREETSEIIDGFHRVAAMKELGFQDVECILTPCDDEIFWDLRIMSASLHKAVTFARVVDWIDEIFKLSQWKNKYKNARTLFEGVHQGYATKEAATWVQSKAQAWGLAPATIRNWLATKESLPEDVLKKAKAPPYQGREGPPLSAYIRIAEGLSGKPDLQRQAIEKVEKEELTDREVRELTKAVREAADEEEAKDILDHPFSRTAEEVTREVRVERIISAPQVQKAREEAKKIEMHAEVVRLKLLMEEVAAFGQEFDLLLLDNLDNEHINGLILAIDTAQSGIQSIRNRLEELVKEPRRTIASGEYKVLPD